MKTASILAISHRKKIILKTIQKLPSVCLVSIAQKGGTLAVEGEKSSVVLTSPQPTMPQDTTMCQEKNVPPVAIITDMFKR